MYSHGWGVLCRCASRSLFDGDNDAAGISLEAHHLKTCLHCLVGCTLVTGHGIPWGHRRRELEDSRHCEVIWIARRRKCLGVLFCEKSVLGLHVNSSQFSANTWKTGAGRMGSQRSGRRQDGTWRREKKQRAIKAQVYPSAEKSTSHTRAHGPAHPSQALEAPASSRETTLASRCADGV